MKHIILYIITSILALGAKAQYVDAFLHKIPIEDILPTDKVNAICQDNNGMIWLGTNNGLISFDGYHLESFTNDPDISSSISSNKISTLLADATGRIWIGTNDNGVSIYTPSSKQWRHINFTPNDSTGLPASKVYCIYEFNERYIAIGTHAPDILLVDKLSFETKRIHITEILHYDDRTRNTRAITVDNKDHNIWWIVGRGGLVRYNAATNRAQPFLYGEIGKSERTVYNAMNCIYQDDEHLWIGTWGGGLLSFNKKTNEFISNPYNIEQIGSGSTNCIFSILAKNDSVLWVGTSDRGLGSFNKKTKKYHFYTHDPTNKHSAPSENVLALYTDKNNDIWIGSTSGAYLANTSKQIYSTYTLPSGPNSDLQRLHYPIFAIPIAGMHKMIVGMHYGNGLNIVDRLNGKVKTYVPKFFSKEQGFRPINCFRYNEDEYLVVTISGICFFNTRTEQWRYIEEHDNKAISKGSIRSSHLSGDSVLLLGTFSGAIRKYNLKTNTLQEWDKDSEPKSYKVFDRSIFLDIIQDKKGRILATSFYGLAVIDPYKNIVYSYSSNDGNDYRHYRGLGGLQKDTDGYIWVETAGGGVMQLDHNNEYRPLRSITTKDGLSSNEVTGCIIDDHRRYWISTERTLQCFDSNKNLILTLNNDQGLPPYYNTWCSAMVYDDELYISWKHNVTTAKVNDILKRPPARPLVVTSVSCKQLQLNKQESISLNHDQNFINIQFSEYDYRYYKDIVFKYRFSNDMDWVDNGSRNNIDLIGLAPGRYNLQVKQISKTYNWQQTNDLLSFIIRPPFYKTWWFLSLIIIGITAGLFLLYRYRYRNLKRVEALKTEFNKKVAYLEMEALRAQMNPHFIFNSLNSINYYIVKRKPEDASAYLNKFAKLIRNILTFSKADSISLSEELNIITLYCELEQMRFQKHFGYKISIDHDLDTDTIMVPPLLLQPYVENAVWHGIMQKEDGGDIEINITSISNGYQFSIKDNGIGRKRSTELRSKTSLKRKSFGTQITSDRVDVFNKLHENSKLSIEIIDLEDNENTVTGTEVIIKLIHNTHG